MQNKKTVRKPLLSKPDFTKVAAKPVFSSKQLELDNLQRINSGKTVVLNNNRKRPSFIQGKIIGSKVKTAGQALKALNSIHYLMGFKNAEQEFETENEYEVGTTKFYRFQQCEQGIPVYGHQIVISVDEDGYIDTLSGYYVPVSANDSVKITAEQAEQKVKKSSGLSILSKDGLQYYVDENERAVLTWVFTTEEARYFVSVKDGTIVKKLSLIIDYNQVIEVSSKNMLGRSIKFPVCYDKSDGIIKLWDPKRNIRIYDAQLKTDRAGSQVGDKTLSKAGDNKEAITVYEHAIKIHDYYKNILGWTGADNNNRLTHITVNYWQRNTNGPEGQTPQSHPYTNAFYGGAYLGYTQICIGNGRHIANALDVLGHEFTHAVSDSIWSASSYYQDECGAVNEAYSDIMGELIQDGIIDMIGETVDGYSKGGFRSFSQDITYASLQNPKAEYDNGYVHANSRIITHAAYLIQQNWPGSNSAHELATLFFRSMPYLFTGCNFKDCRTAVLKSAYCMKLSSKKIKVIKDAFDHIQISNEDDNKASYDSSRRVYSISGIVRDKNTNKPVSGALIRFAKEHTRFNKARADQSEVFLKTDQNGYYYTSALKPGNYSELVTKSTGKGKHLESRKNVTIDGANVSNCSLTEQNNLYVTDIYICSDKDSTNAKNQCPNYQVLLEKDLNYGVRGLFLYVRYYMCSERPPITGVVLVKSKTKLTWKESTFTLDGVTAKYTRINVDLNGGEGGTYIYLCYTTDKALQPLTGLNAMYDFDDLAYPWIMTPWAGTHQTANANEGTTGKPVYINWKIQEEWNPTYL